MQSIGQFRRIGQRAQAQLDQSRQPGQPHDGRGALPPSDVASPTPQPGADASQPSDADRDVEKLDHSNNNGSNNSSSSTPASDDSLPRKLKGVTVKDGSEYDLPGQVFLVSWEGPDDPLNPRNWPTRKRIIVTLELALISAAVVIPSSITSAALPQAAADYGVSNVVESLATGLFLIGIGVGSLLAGPFSETFGRNIVYGGSLTIFMAMLLGSALSPNIGAQLAFRFLAGCCGSTPIVCCGGSVADMWSSLEKTWSFPLYVSLGFCSSVLGPVVGAYIAPSPVLSWRWTDWVCLCFAGAVLLWVFVFMPETYPPLLLRWRAMQYRRAAGDERFKSEEDIAGATFARRLANSMTRPFLFVTEPIIFSMTLYMTILYIVLFTFLVGWTFIFEDHYAISQGLTHIIFVAMFVGMQFPGLLVPFIYKKTAKAVREGESNGDSEKPKSAGFKPELRLWYAMLGPAVAIPVSLFWMGWTARASISIWSPILAAGLFGFGMSGMFICIYLYIIDSYESYSASALTFVSLVRYVASGGMTVVGVPFYSNLGSAYTLTILACISVVLVPVPYVLYKYGHLLRAKSRFAVSR